ncbi:GNAT family N-acetyltransferase [Puniceibacterium sediminis]|uniref:L-ornithine N(alpha)-acyltransferase n=1 Tax=Puniceibacterium sediminis TaxID=1608407 RepID=A0A238XSJ0_9RHOB|nr:GNAT family N-acyltransferase [Puniceibacterium sediminis]SNR61481.1 ornithine-acyl[acyl carrier protein] N-acyltransferase [Puniceibacterium sediminis]
MNTQAPQFSAHLAQTDQDLQAAQRLRYDVFVRELGGGGGQVDHENGLEKDRFDPFFDHLLLRDEARHGAVIGVYRLLPGTRAETAGGFYSEAEYDLDPLRRSGRNLLELGRSCLHPEYRGGSAMFYLWQALAAYVAEREIEILFGVASFHGTDINALAHPLSHLSYRHSAPEALRVRAREYQPMALLAEPEVDRKRAMIETPALIKAYLRLGGCVGDGAYVDHAFNTTDVCLIMDTARMNERQKSLYTKGVVG